MKWDYWRTLYLQRYCVVRGLQAKTIDAYSKTLIAFRLYVKKELEDKDPDRLCANDLLQYFEYLRKVRGNGNAAVNRHDVILRNFFRLMVTMGHLDANKNPMAHFPKMKAVARKFSETLSLEEVERLLDEPRSDTVLGLRDRAMLTLLYGTGIRASECARLRECDIDFEARTIRVIGKGGDERTIPLNDQVVQVLSQYLFVRGKKSQDGYFFQSRNGRGVTRNTVYERVRKFAKKAKIPKKVSPHRLRHTFATHLVRKGVNLVTLRDLLGHRHISSTQIYIHMTGEDLRRAAEKHPVKDLVKVVEGILPKTKMPFQYPPSRRFG